MARCFLYKSASFKVCWTLFSLVILESNVAGQLTLSPVSVAPVCRVGDPFQLTCTAESVQFMRWNVLQPNEQAILEEVANVQINARDFNVQMSQREVDSATLTFMRTSAQFDTPFISTLSIDSVSIGLNGTVVNCSDVSNPMTSSSTTIQIVDVSQISTQYTPVLRVSEEYQANNVTVTVMWAPAELMDNNNITFSTEVSPLVPIISIGSTSRQLIISYNTEYNLSVVAVALCGNATASKILNYVNCGYPDLLSTIGNDSAMSNESDSSFSAVPTISTKCSESVQIEGCTITFSCPPGLGLTGPNSATCAGNGEWEPDPSGLMCTGVESSAADLGQMIGIIVPLVLVLIIIAIVIVVLLRKKGCSVINPRTKSGKDLQLTAKYLDKGHPHQPEGRLVYADLEHDNASEIPNTKKKATAADPANPKQDVEYSLIDYNLNICYEDTQLEGQQKRDNSLDVTLNRLVVLLRDKVGPKWREFGEATDIDEVVLDSIAKTCFPENCIVEVLDYWLKYSDEKITWRDVAYVLKSINFHELALDVVQIYKTGKFPEADTRDKLETPSDDKQPTVKKQDNDPKKGPGPVVKDSNKQPIVPVKKQDTAPGPGPMDPQTGQGADSSKHQKLLKIPLPLPSKK